jgi:hypothetical protein
MRICSAPQKGVNGRRIKYLDYSENFVAESLQESANPDPRTGKNFSGFAGTYRNVHAVIGDEPQSDFSAHGTHLSIFG